MQEIFENKFTEQIKLTHEFLVPEISNYLLYHEREIKETAKNIIEQIGISKTQEAFKKADLIILIFDYSKGWTKNDQSIIKQIPKSIIITARNLPNSVVGAMSP